MKRARKRNVGIGTQKNKNTAVAVPEEITIAAISSFCNPYEPLDFVPSRDLFWTFGNDNAIHKSEPSNIDREWKN
jgi:hypothetical protein